MVKNKNIIYIHIPKTGGTTFSSHFEGVMPLSEEIDPKLLIEERGTFVKLHIPNLTLLSYCKTHKIDIKQVLKASIVILTIRDPVEWVESYWNHCLYRKRIFRHILFEEEQIDQIINIHNGFTPTNFDNGMILNETLDTYLNRIKDFSFLEYASILQYNDRLLYYYRNVDAIARKNFTFDKLYIHQGAYDLTPYRDFSIFNHCLQLYLTGYISQSNKSLYWDLINSFVIPSNILTAFLEYIRSNKSQKLFLDSGLTTLYERIAKDQSILKYMNQASVVNAGKKYFKMNSKSEKLVKRNMSQDYFLNKTLSHVWQNLLIDLNKNEAENYEMNFLFPKRPEF